MAQINVDGQTYKVTGILAESIKEELPAIHANGYPYTVEFVNDQGGSHWLYITPGTAVTITQIPGE